MIKIPNYIVKEASRVYGDFAEKVAFDLTIDPASVMGSIAGGYTANHVFNKAKAKADEKERAGRRIENNTYSQVESIMRDLKIVFTPINVIYSVNGQVFEIVRTDEMNPYMRSAFQKKDADYFRNLLVNKVNMELQLAEQAFAQRLLSAGGYNQTAKQASYSAKQEAFVKLAEEEMEDLVKTANANLPDTKLKMNISFDSLRPFSKNDFFFNPNSLSKVAGIFDIFDTENSDDISLHRLNKEVNVGFLPDRVVYTWNGQLIEQMTLLQMNEDGYKAFQEKDKQFFIDFFRKYTKESTEALSKPQQKKAIPPRDDVPSPRFETFNEDLKEEMDKDAASLEDIVEDLVEEEFPVIERERINLFQDPDIHPVTYDYVLNDRYGENWATHEFEAILKQIEIDFELRDGISENPLNKLSILHAISSPDHAMYQAPLTFEKFIRGVNSKDIIFEEFQGNLSFEEIMFGLEVAKSYDGDEVFLEFHDNIAPYIAEELMNNGVRFVSQQLYDESNPSEKDFFNSINGFLLRKWKDRDAQGILDEEAIEQQYTMAVQITEMADEVLTNYAELIDVTDPYSSVKKVIADFGILDPVDSEFKTGVLNMVTETVVSHFLTGLFLEYKFQELNYILGKLREEGVLRG